MRSCKRHHKPITPRAVVRTEYSQGLGLFGNLDVTTKCFQARTRLTGSHLTIRVQHMAATVCNSFIISVKGDITHNFYTPRFLEVVSSCRFGPFSVHCVDRLGHWVDSRNMSCIILLIICFVHFLTRTLWFGPHPSRCLDVSLVIDERRVSSTCLAESVLSSKSTSSPFFTARSTEVLSFIDDPPNQTEIVCIPWTQHNSCYDWASLLFQCPRCRSGSSPKLRLAKNCRALS